MDSSGRILIPGIYEDVAKVTDEEMKLYAPIDFNFEEHKTNIGVKEFLYKTKVQYFQHNVKLLVEIQAVTLSVPPLPLTGTFAKAVQFRGS